METKVCKDCGRELPIERFKIGRTGVRVGICTDCVVRKARENKARREEEIEKNARAHALDKFTSRELIEELAHRGYKGTLEYVQVHKIDITNF